MRRLIFGILLFLTTTLGLAFADAFKPRRPLGLIEVDQSREGEMTQERVNLGERLFLEKRLSRTKSTSCSTCHDPNYAFAEPRVRSVSDNGRTQRRNAPSLLNVGYLPSFMWDGRFDKLERASLDPFKEKGDMGIEVEEAVTFLKNDREYRELFLEAFGGPPSLDNLGVALASFQRSLVSGDSLFDKYLFGADEAALSPLQKFGLEVFSTKGGCLNCHDVFHPRFNPLGGGVALFTDFRFHNLGISYVAGRLKDVGRLYVTRATEDIGGFRTPNLRNVELTAPYMHDGSVSDLYAVVDLYDRGGVPNPYLSPSIRPLHLTELEKLGLVAFLKSLTDPGVAAEYQSGTQHKTRQ